MKSAFGQSFVDPKFYEETEKILYDFTREIPFDQIEILDSQKFIPGQLSPSNESRAGQKLLVIEN